MQVARAAMLALVVIGAACGGNKREGLGPDPEQPGSLSLGVEGLPAGATAHVEVSGPGGYRHSVAATETLTGLVPGTYTVQATEVVAEGDVYQPAPVTQSAVVRSA
ncbi:MAG: hypothetical protein AB7S39_20330, partial [Gemmatimonadales bacterium]